MTGTTGKKSTLTEAEIQKQIRAYIVKSLVGIIFYAALLMLLRGRWDWLWGWLFIGLMAAASVAQYLLLLPTNPALLAERSTGIRAYSKKWDRWVLSTASVLGMIGWIVAPLDVRNGWGPEMGLGLHIGGALVFALGWVLILWATCSNAYFTTTVQIQEHQTVYTGGPYRIVRHPGYLGAILYCLSTGFLLGSWWAALPCGLAVIVYVVRTALEDRTLRAELEGYEVFTEQTRFRLIPGIW
jgi:protein-S-isoprenylcysteine O-methyltransferase Ste14